MTRAQSSDRQLVRSILDGDKERYAEVVRRYMSAVYGTTLALTKRRAEALELTQQTFIRAYERLAYFRTDSLQGWLVAIAHHLALDFLSCEQRHRTLPLDETLAAAATPYSSEQEAQLQRLERAIATLPPADSTLLRLYYYQHLSTKEIAAALRLTQSNVLVRLHRLRERLRNDLNNTEI